MEALAASGLVVALQFLALSALATDYHQTQHWVDGVHEHPVVTPEGWLLIEQNPLLRGRPAVLEPYFDLLAAGVEAAPRMLSPPFALALLGCVAFGDGWTVLRNNEFARVRGLPQYWMIAYRWHF